MVGRLRTNFRSGNLAEALGSLLLKEIATVADVPRTEDVGLDVVANLLRFDEDGNCYAEDSFGVQLKAEREDKVEYAQHGLKWVLSQSQPWFIGKVSRKDASIALYATLHVYQAVLALYSDALTVRFGPKADYPPWELVDPLSEVTVWLGDPVIKWSLGESLSPEWREKAYRNIKRFLEIARRELELLSYGFCSEITWNTNDVNSISTKFGLLKGNPREIPLYADKCRAGIEALFFNLAFSRNEMLKKAVVPLYTFITELQRMGIEMDQEGRLKKILSLVVQTKPEGKIKGPDRDD